MPIDRQTIVHVADLARIRLSDEETLRFTGQLSVVLDAVARLGEVDTSAVLPSASVLPLQDVQRDDEARPGLTNAQALANAPKGGRDGEFFRVQEVLEER
ncbi:MAG TPA: Asp-tRNA(Asn)/Glu-tRNA(Gln) amidotransferase subunit GatC [Candidatus Limnocylindria bacterium]|nr:Asp-tRNA(Asn)/Glu-tRNA(Gln) amidotransferase subunit GatC [Candidatus Limnocylindria bacterium]